MTAREADEASSWPSFGLEPSCPPFSNVFLSLRVACLRHPAQLPARATETLVLGRVIRAAFDASHSLPRVADSLVNCMFHYARPRHPKRAPGYNKDKPNCAAFAPS